MDDKGRTTDNVCIERFWQSIKCEEIYLNEYKNMRVLKKAIEKYTFKYNTKRLHSAIDYQTPIEVHYQAANILAQKGERELAKAS